MQRSRQNNQKSNVRKPTQQTTRDRLARTDLVLTNWEKQRKIIDYAGILCGDKPWDMTNSKVRSIIFLCSGPEGRKSTLGDFR